MITRGEIAAYVKKRHEAGAPRGLQIVEDALETCRQIVSDYKKKDAEMQSLCEANQAIFNRANGSRDKSVLINARNALDRNQAAMAKLIAEMDRDAGQVASCRKLLLKSQG